MRALLSEILTQDPIKPDWLVEDILSKGSIIVLAGDAGVGKSMLCYSLALGLASGGKFLGRQLKADRVLYFDQENSAEDSDAYLKRVWWGLGSPDTALLDANLFLHRFSLSQNYAAEMREAAAQTTPGLIVIDTANAACQIDDENDNAKASAAIKALRAVKHASGRPDTVMLILKHAKVSHDKKGHEHRDIRGAKTWKGELDGLIIHTAAVGRPRHGSYRNTFLWPYKSRAFGLTRTIEIVPTCNGEAVMFEEKRPG